MNKLKTMLVTGVILATVLTTIFLIGVVLFDFNIIDPANAGFYILAVLVSVFVVLPALFFLTTNVEYFSNSMMVFTMVVGALFVFSDSSMLFTIGWIAFCLTLQAFGFFKFIHSGIGSALGHGYVAVAGKPKKHYL